MGIPLQRKASSVEYTKKDGDRYRVSKAAYLIEVSNLPTRLELLVGDLECLKGWKDTIKQALDLFRANQGDIDNFRRYARDFNNWMNDNAVVQKLQKVAGLSESWNSEDILDAIGWDWYALFGLLWFLGRQVHVPGVVHRLKKKLRAILIQGSYSDEKDLDKSMRQLSTRMDSSNPHFRKLVGDNCCGFVGRQRTLFGGNYKENMEGVICTSQCFTLSACGWCDGCEAYRNWYEKHKGADEGAPPPAPRRDPPVKNQTPNWVPVPTPAPVQTSGWGCPTPLMPPGPRSTVSSSPRSNIWAPRK